MKYLAILLSGLLLMSCGEEANDEQEAGKKVELKSADDKLSYTLGAKEAWDILNSRDSNVDKFDHAELLKGFKEGFRPGVADEKAPECMETIQNMYGGAQGVGLDMNYVKPGCNCIGLLTSGMVFQELDFLGMSDRINKELFFRGFEDGLARVDTVLTQEQKTQIMNSFNQEVQAVIMAQVDKRWAEIKAIEGIEELENGIYLETIKAGSGAKPSLNSDIAASYILRDFSGNEIENSSRQPNGQFIANLHEGQGGLIKGWVLGFQHMQKGGRYRLYVPAEMAYGDRPLEFEIELFNFGPAGSLKK